MRKKKLIEENASLKAGLTAMSYKSAELDRDLREAKATIKQMTVDREDQCEHAYFNGVGDTTKRLKKELSDAKQDLREMTQDRDILVNTEARLERKIGELEEKLAVYEQEFDPTYYFGKPDSAEIKDVMEKMRNEPAVIEWREMVTEHMRAENEKLEGIKEQREEIVKAFIAQHGCSPDECEQVVENTTTVTKWYVRKKAGASKAKSQHDALESI